jgi:hypothetical protein
VGDCACVLRRAKIFAYHSGPSHWYGWDSRIGTPFSIPDLVRAIAPGKDHGPILFESLLSHFDLNSLPEQNNGTTFRFLHWRGPVS